MACGSVAPAPPAAVIEDATGSSSPDSVLAADDLAAVDSVASGPDAAPDTAAPPVDAVSQLVDAAPDSADSAPADDAMPAGDTGPDSAADAAKSDTTAPAVDAAQDSVVVVADSAASDIAAADVAAGDAPADAAAADGSAYVPAPIPAVDPEPPPPCAKAKASADYFQFLDNLCDEKVVPKNVDFEFACPIVDPTATATTAAGTAVAWQSAAAKVAYGPLQTATPLPAGLQVAVILVRRVAGEPLFRYLSNGTAEVAVQPWSTTKFLAAANAAVRLRVQSNYKVGLTAKVGSLWVGNLVTSLVNYDNQPYSSNALGAWFHDVGGRAKANAMIGADWLQRPANETFGGNYGAAVPGGLGYTFAEVGGATVAVAADKTGSFANNLSMHTLAEALKRLVLHREIASQRLPGIQWADVRTLLYGAGPTGGGPANGGLSADTAIYLQSGHDMAYLDKRANGQWRIFSKLGLGTKGQFVHVGYACMPVLDPAGKPVAGWGREFLIAAHLTSGGATWAERDRLLAKAYRAIVPRIIDGTL